MSGEEKSEFSYFYRYCLVVDKNNSNLNEYLINTLKENSFDVKTVDHQDSILILLSQTSEKKLLIEAQLRKIRKLTVDAKKTHSKLPQNVIDEEKRKYFSLAAKGSFIPDKNFDTFYKLASKKKDEVWGLNLFTEAEMLYLEKGILSEMLINKEKFNQALTQDKLLANDADKINQYLEGEKRLFFVFEHYHLIKECFPLHTSVFKDELCEGVLSFVKFDPHKLRNYQGDYVSIYFYWLDHYTSKSFYLITY